MSNAQIVGISFRELMRCPGFAEGCWSVAMGEGLYECKAYERAHPSWQWAYERGRLFAQLYRGQIFKKKEPLPLAVNAFAHAYTRHEII